jgi:hypothetical protein
MIKSLQTAAAAMTYPERKAARDRRHAMWLRKTAATVPAHDPLKERLLRLASQYAAAGRGAT